MENKDRDKLNRTPQSTEAGNVNRQSSAQVGKDTNDTSADFGQNIGRAENLNEPNQRSGSNWDESSGRNSGSGSMKGSSQTRDVNDLDRDRDRDSSMDSNTRDRH